MVTIPFPPGPALCANNTTTIMATKVTEPKAGRTTKARKAPAATPSAALHRVRFALAQHEAESVYLAGTFNEWHPTATPMRNGVGEFWSVELELPAGVYEYRFLVNGDWVDDPQAAETADNPFGGRNAVLRIGSPA
jgi:1,4-alpha-glucan branching enzyme